MVWHLHRWTRWRSFTYIEIAHDMYVRIGKTYARRTAMQEKTCTKCGKIKQRKV